LNGQWYLALMPGNTWTERVLRCDSFGQAAWLARAWIQKQGDKRLRNDVLLECDDRLHPLHFSTVYAADDDHARRLVAERWLRTEPELRLQIVRLDGDRLTRVTNDTDGGPT
jgi:hypothetical protein